MGLSHFENAFSQRDALLRIRREFALQLYRKMLDFRVRAEISQPANVFGTHLALVRIVPNDKRCEKNEKHFSESFA